MRIPGEPNWGLPVAPKKTGAPPRTMQDTKYCSSCKNKKPAGDFIHPRTGKDKKTCAECIMKRSAAAKRKAPVDTTATLQLHTARLDDHEGRIKSVEETLYDYDAAGAPPAPDAPGAGDGTFTKSQLRRQKRKNKMAARAAARALDFVLIGGDAASDSTDLDSLASTHSCVRALIEENRQLTADLRGMRGMRLLLRDPSFLQRVGRGMVGRSRAKSRLAAVRKLQVLVRRRAKCKFAAIVKLQAWVRASLHVSLWRKCRRSLVGLQGRARVRKARAICQRKREIKAAVGIGAAWRRYHVLSTTLFGKLLSKPRCLAKKLAKANEILAANERELKNVVHATLCVSSAESDPPTDVVVAEGASPFIKVLSKFIPAITNYATRRVSEALAQSTFEELKVEVHGKHINWTDEAIRKGLPSQFHTGKLVKMDDASGLYEVELDSVWIHRGTTQEKKYRDTFSAQNFRIL